MITIPTAVALIALASLAGAGFAGVAFLLREVGRATERADKAEARLVIAQSKTLTEAKGAQLALERVATDATKLEEKRIESGRNKVEVRGNKVEVCDCTTTTLSCAALLGASALTPDELIELDELQADLAS